MVRLTNLNGKDNSIIHPYLCGVGWCGVVWFVWVVVGGGGVGMEWSGVVVVWGWYGSGVALQCKVFHHPTFRFITIHTSCRTESSKY